MIIESPFELLLEPEQNRLLALLAHQIRPMLGEIGEVVIREKNGRRPGFIGLLFGHGKDRAIVFAEYVDEKTRIRERSKRYSVGNQLYLASDPYIAEIIKAGCKDPDGGMGASNALSLANISSETNNAALVFAGCYGEAAKTAGFMIKLIGKPLRNEGGNIRSMLYFAFKEGDDINRVTELIDQLSKLVEQLIRNALGLAAISNQELRGAVSYLTDRLPQSFSDYVRPQVLAAIYAYVREVVPGAIPAPGGMQVGTMPEVECDQVTGEIFSDKELANKLKSIHTASLIRVNRAVGGSLKGASVYSLSITTKHEGGATTYSAIAKFSTLAEARDEADGLRRIQRFYANVGKMLPPPLEVYLIAKNGEFEFDKKNWNGRWTELKCISVTPDLDGAVLSEKITEHWASPTLRVERFGGYLRSARDFVDKLRKQPIELANVGSAPNATISPDKKPADYLADFFCEFLKSKERFNLLATGFDFPEGMLLKMKLARDHEICVVNPAAWIHQMLETPDLVNWKPHSSRKISQVWTHGDFHSGNLFLSAVDEHLTVLDYDRVGPGAPEKDLARLDGSFVAFVFSLRDLNQPGHWRAYAPCSLALLTSCHPAAFHVMQQNGFARDLMETLKVIRPASPCPFHAAFVIRALLIQLKTACTKRDRGNPMLVNDGILKASQGRNAATWLYLAMLLGQLVEPKGSPVGWNDPFNSALRKS